MEANTALAFGHLQNVSNIMPTLDFHRKLAMYYTENTIGTERGDIGRPTKSCRRPHIVEYHLEKVPNYRGKWLPSAKKNPSRNIKSSAEPTIQNAGPEHGIIADAPDECFYEMDYSQITR